MTLWRQHHRLYTAVSQQGIERVGEFTVPIVDEIALAQKKPIKMLGEPPNALLHEGGIGMRGDSSNLNPSCAQLHYHQDIVGHQPLPEGDFHREEVRGSDHFPMQLEKCGPAQA